jgi:hypothetical protein
MNDVPRLLVRSIARTVRVTRIRSATAAVVLCAAQSSTAADQGASGQSLEQAASDPTASLMSVQVQDIYAGAYYLLDDERGNTILLRSAVPFTTGRLENIARLTLPVVTDSSSGKSGLGDLVLFDLIKFEESWGRWGIGPVLLAPTATDDALGAGKWAIGPALGFVARSDKLMWGLFNQNLLSFAGNNNRKNVRVIILQPIVNFSLPNKWSIGTSEMNITYDWEQDAWTALPLGVKLARLVKFGRLPVQISGAYEYNFADDYVAPQWTVNVTVKVLFPI